MSEKKTITVKMAETDDGTILFNTPFPTTLDEQTLAVLKHQQPIIIKQPYQIDYIHSFGQDSPWFSGLANKHLLGNRDSESGYTYAQPRGHDMYSGSETDWVELPQQGRVHAFTVCHFGSEEFLSETPFVLALVEFDGVDTLSFDANTRLGSRWCRPRLDRNGSGGEVQAPVKDEANRYLFCAEG